MKQPLPPNNREELEAQVTALLLGELTEEHAAAVRALIAQDRELAKWHDTLKQTLPMVRETVVTPATETSPQPAPLKLSPERQEKLLAHFKTVAPKEFDRPFFRRKNSWLVPLASAAAVALVAIVSVQSFVNSRTSEVPTFGIRKSSQPPATYKVDIDSRNLHVLGDDEVMDPDQFLHPRAANPIVLPPGSVDNYGAANRDGEGGLTGGTATSSARSTFQSRRAAGRARSGGGGGGGAQSAEKPGTELSGVARQPTEPVQTAEGLAASTPPAFLDLQPEESKSVETVEARTMSRAEGSQSTQLASRESERSITETMPTAGKVDDLVTFAPGAAPQGQTAVNRAIGVQGGTAPQGQIVRVGGFTDPAEFVPQAQSAAGSTIGVPIVSVPPITSAVSTRQQGNTEALGDTQTVAPLFGFATAAPVQLAQAASQSDTKKSEQASREAEKVDRLSELDAAVPKGAVPPPVPQPEVQTLSNAFSTFSLNVSDVAFKLAAASLENGVMPNVSSMRSEEFINAFDYRDPEPAPGAPIGFAWERAGDPFAHNRDFLRFSVKTAAQGRDAGRPLNLVLLLDKSGSMERADRVEIIRQALTVLAGQLQARDTLSVVTFARTPRLWVDGVPGNQAGEIAKKLGDITPEGGTNLEEAMRLAYATALRHYLSNGENRVVLLTDGAANLGEVDPDVFKPWVESNRKQGIALDCFGIGWDGYNDTTLESLSRTGGGRYGFINTPEEAATGFAGQLAGALRIAASDVKVQVEFNPNRVFSYRQIGYANHQLTKEQFRDNTVAAAQIGAAESGNALYTVEVNAAGDGPICTARVRYRDPGTSDYHEHAWDVPYTGAATPLDKAAPAMRLAAGSAAFSEWLAGSPFASEVTLDKLLNYLNGIPVVYGADTRPQKLEWMVRHAKSISGK
jgi:Mg-chelatase subunit ChlD